ncbi:Polyketide cyclase / dehydrase and lipid transport [Tenacibaculum sp. MAR_2009_124]|uniref:SRPBCC family protein n=1 Tax=Tenacibaculum sp. MAR_2009_124 TaxID=1250059 RepID=UPI000898BB00|nr:SRPBCC family protein [Tenacibaculum sp. MAR_2009_124]SEC92059.1 Polyketide cyclase / dehydrase and lipid transport [Tenacibaculum sp. MAR_2009_124]
MSKQNKADQRKMKIVKIVLGVVVALSIAFFAIGIFVQELNYTSKVTIDKPLSEVFKLFNNDEKMSKWIPEIKSIKSVLKTEEIKGSTFLVTVNNQGNEVVLEEKVLDFIDNKKVRLLFKGGGMLKVGGYSFETLSDGMTQLTLESNVKSDNFILGCLLPLMKGKLADQDQQYLNNFKKFAESSND